MGFLKMLLSYIQTTINHNQLKKQAEINAYKQQEQCQHSKYAQLWLQDALFNVLHKVNISSSLCKLHNAQELLPFGFKVHCDENIYYYTWTKNTTDVIPISMLQRYVARMNIAIQSECNKFRIYLQQFDYITQAELIQTHPLLFNGFVVRNCKDIGDAIVLAVST